MAPAPTPASGTREKVLDAAAKVFLQHGFGAASMEQVRQAAGVSNGSLYHHYPTKAQLADALYGHTLRDFHASLLAVIAGGVPAEQGVKGMVRAYVQWVLKHPDRARLLHTLRRTSDVADASTGERNAANADAFAGLRQWVRAEESAGRMREMPFQMWIALVFAPAMSLTQHWVRDAKATVAPKVRAALEHAAWMAVAP